jgi:hypothetical protein
VLPNKGDIILTVTDSRGATLIKKQYQKTAVLDEAVFLPMPGEYIITVKVGNQLISRKIVRH